MLPTLQPAGHALDTIHELFLGDHRATILQQPWRALGPSVRGVCKVKRDDED